jgi:hypothetical protein
LTSLTDSEAPMPLPNRKSHISGCTMLETMRLFSRQKTLNSRHHTAEMPRSSRKRIAVRMAYVPFCLCRAMVSTQPPPFSAVSLRMSRPVSLIKTS